MGLQYIELLSLGPDELITNCSIFVKQGLQNKSNRNCLTWPKHNTSSRKRNGEGILNIKLQFRHTHTHSLNIAFRHFPPNSARIGYTTEGALFISAQLSTDAVSALRKVWVPIRLWKQPSAQERT